MDIEKLVRDNIDQSFHMSLATVSGNRPWVCEVHFAYDKDLNLYWLSQRSSRHSEEISVNSAVAGDIIDNYPPDNEDVVGVYFEGRAKLIEAESERQQAFRAMKGRLGITDQDYEDSKDPARYNFYKVAVTDWYVFGAFNGQPQQKYHLKWRRGTK